MAKCTSCSAPLPSESIICNYCGSRNDIDLQGVNYYTTNAVDSERVCPRCDIRVKTIDLQLNGRFLIERCEECFGLFFDPGELDALLQATVSNVFEIDRNKLNAINAVRRCEEYGISYIKCPVCRNLMNRVSFGTKSGVVVNRCREHGVWLDGGELRHLFEWMKAGGKILAQEQEEQRKKEEAQKEREERRKNLVADESGFYPDSPGYNSYGQTLHRSDPDLFDLVTNALRFFLK